MSSLSQSDEDALVRFAMALVDQQRATTIVKAQQNASGFWFGGGNMVQAADGSLLVVGRYRNAGDSRSGVGAGERGRELAVFRAMTPDRPFDKVLSLAKADLHVGDREVLSIEGAALRLNAAGAAELFVSSEKTGIEYPEELQGFLKPGTGVWTIDRLHADSLAGLAAARVETVLESRDPRFIHVKDPVLYQPAGGERKLFFCSHPYCWTSSNSGYAPLAAGEDTPQSVDLSDVAVFDFFPRGFTWDVAMTRATCVFDVPRVGRFRDRDVALIFYDGGESVRNLEEHAAAVSRPRGYSCEELGGAAYVVDGDFSRVQRLQPLCPLFVSPWGTGCSRYVDVLAIDAGICTTWQQSQVDLSQPLVMHFLPIAEVAGLLE